MITDVSTRKNAPGCELLNHAPSTLRNDGSAPPLGTVAPIYANFRAARLSREIG